VRARAVWGCGKSTLLNALAGFALPTRRDRGAAGRCAGLARTGHGLSGYAISLDDRGRQRGLRLRIKARPRDYPLRRGHWLDKLALTNSATLSKHLSGGMRQRVAIARSSR